jgi:very-short-patch-repair endonuclease
MSPPEAKLWVLLRTEPFRAAHFRRQVPVGPYYADFASHTIKLIIEVDGSQHTTDEAIRHDRRRTEYLKSEGYRVIRFTSVEIFQSMDGVHGLILEAVGQST